MLIDSHAHISFKEYQDDLKEVIQRSFDNKTWIINVGSNFATSKRNIELADEFGSGLWAVIGLHPIHLIKDIEEKAVFDGHEQSFITPQEDFNYDKYKQLAQSSSSVVGLGETGLDFFHLDDDKDNSIEDSKKKQIKVFKQIIKLSQELDLPLVLHCRGSEENPDDAYDEMLNILSSLPNAQCPVPGGVIHCFGGNATHARKFLDLGFYIGFTGIVTFKNAKDLQQIAKNTPLDRILIETDSPFLAPDPFRGKRNEPSYVQYVCQKIADLKELTFDRVEKQTFDNAVSLFKL